MKEEFRVGNLLLWEPSWGRRRKKGSLLLFSYRNRPLALTCAERRGEVDSLAHPRKDYYLAENPAESSKRHHDQTSGGGGEGGGK